MNYKKGDKLRVRGCRPNIKYAVYLGECNCGVPHCGFINVELWQNDRIFDYSAIMKESETALLIQKSHNHHLTGIFK